MAAQQVRVFAGSASALAAVALALAGCAAAGHQAAATAPRPASQTAASGYAGPQTAARAATASRLASVLLKCADPVAPGRVLGSAGGVRSAAGPDARAAAGGGSASPSPAATVGRVMVRQVGMIKLSRPGLVVVCGPAAVHCPPGYRILYRTTLSGRGPRALLPYVAVCIGRFRISTLPPEPRLTPLPARTMPLHTMPPSQA